MRLKVRAYEVGELRKPVPGSGSVISLTFRVFKLLVDKAGHVDHVNGNIG